MEEKNPTESPKKVSVQESGRHISKAVLYSAIFNYGGIPINFLLTYFIAHTLDINIWGHLIYAMVLITGSQIFINFFPPSISSVLLYRIPELIANNQISKAKGYFIYAIKTRSLVCLITIVGYIIVGNLFLLGKIELSAEYNSTIIGNIILIQCPAIFTDQIYSLIVQLFFIYKRYKVYTYLAFQEKFLYLFAYMYLYYANLPQVDTLYIIAFIRDINIIMVTPFYLWTFFSIFKNVQTEKTSWKEIKASIVYGMNFTIISALGGGYSQAYSAFITAYGKPEFHTINNVANNTTHQALSAFTFPITPVLTDLEKSNQHDKMLLLFEKTIKFTNIITAFFIGGLFYFTPFYMHIFYPAQYWDYIIIVQISLFSAYFAVVLGNYSSLLIVLEKVNKYLYIETISIIIRTLFAFLGMYFFGIFGLIMSTLISSFITLLFYWGYCRAVKITLISLMQLFNQLIALSIIVFITSISYTLIQPNLQKLSFITNLYQNEILGLAIDFILQASVFVFLYSLYIILFRIFTIQDLNQIENLNMKLPFKQTIFKIARKFLHN